MKAEFEHGGTIFAVARELGIAPEELLDFSASINPLGSAPGVREAVESSFHRIIHYPDSGSSELCQSLSLCHEIPVEQITVANGSTELIHLLPRLSRFTRKRALLLAPAFSEYAHALELCGWSHDYHILKAEEGFSLDLAAIEKTLIGEYDLLFLCNPGNPTGRLYLRKEVRALYELCQEAGTLLVLDEAFIDFCEEESSGQLLGKGDSLLILRSMTKFFGFPGLRLGYALGSPELIDELARIRPPWSVGLLSQVAGVAALADFSHAEKTRQLVAVERQWLTEQLQEIDCLKVYPSAANYLLVETIFCLTATDLQNRLLEQKILIRNCRNFDGLNERFFRIAVRSREENTRLVNNLRMFLQG